MRSALRVRLLGPLDVRVGDRRVEVRGARQRSLLALLALRRRQVVDIDRIATALWPDDEPADAGRAIVVYVRRLRQALAAGGADPGVVVTAPAGYRLDLAADQVDADEFRALLGRGESALREGRPGEAAILLRQALAGWTAEPLLDVGPGATRWPEYAALVELRWAALSARVDADLALGHGAEILPELRALVAADPLRERPRVWLMAALRAAGRTVDALEVYREGRALLVRTTGLEPGPELRREHAAVLAGDPGPDRVVPVRDEGVAARAGAALRDAARFAGAVGGHGEAVRCWQAALELHAGSAADRGRLLVELGDALADAGADGTAELREAHALLTAEGDGEGVARAAITLARVEWYAGRGPAARELVASAVALVRPLPPSRSTARVLDVGAGLTTLFGSPDGDMAAEAVRHAEAVGVPDQLARALGVQGMTRLHAGDLAGVGDLERAADLQRRSRGWVRASYLLNLFDAYARSGDPVRARQVLDEAQVAATLGAAQSEWRYVAMHRIQVDWWDGRYVEVGARARELRAAAPGRADYAGITAALMLARLRLRDGDLAGALRGAETTSRLAAELGDDQAVLVARAAEARVRAVAGDRAGAARLLAAARDVLVPLFDPLAGSDLGEAVHRAGTGLDLFDGFVPTPWVAATRALATGDRALAARRYRSLGSVADAEIALGEHLQRDRPAL